MQSSGALGRVVRPAFAVLLVVASASCGACRKTDGAPPGATRTSSGSSRESSEAGGGGKESAAALRDKRQWEHAADGGVEDLATLAVHEGAMGLVEAAEEDPSLRPTALRAMAHARGWAQAPFLANVAAGKDDEEARVALDALVELASRERNAEDAEDAAELAEACEKLATLARDEKRAKERRVPAIRAHRMMPCTKVELSTSLDAK